MPDTKPAQRPQLQQQDTLDAPQLIGKLGRNSIAELQPNSAPSSFYPSAKENGKPDTPQQNGVGSQDFASRSKSDSAATSVDSDDTIEDYDELQLDPDTLIANTRASLDGAHRFKSEHGEGNGTAKPSRRRSIQIKLQKTDRKGQYTLTADDPELSDILQKGIEREKREAKDKSRTRFRDLVFTRQFTTFDRQNPATSESPFFGFFTLFWLSMVIIFVQVSMHNWRTYGSILGSNQVMKLMFSRDVFMLGLTDGIMCAATVEAFLLSKLVQKGYVNWAKHGWIIQNIWQTFYLATVIWWTWFREWPWTHSPGLHHEATQLYILQWLSLRRAPTSRSLATQAQAAREH
jgi:sterol O-acyltransferase